MLLLYPGAENQVFQAGQFTFHYASTLSYPFLPLIWLRRSIYIPLCFYFIQGLPPGRSARLLFTFHYASTLSDCLKAMNMILCLFTFHYASTLSRRVLFFCHNLRIFTFHYASTLSRHSFLPPLLFLHLHSTMLLLYLIPVDTAPTTISIFTFHYASTLSERVPGVWSYKCNLHSTMLLLYPERRRGLFKRWMIYIPLCFYFMKNKPCGIRPGHIYIPLCFYFIPSPFSPSIFFNTSILFVYPTFFISLFSKIFLLPLYKI